MKKLFLIVAMFAAFMGVGRLWYLAKDGFSINRIAYPLTIQQPEPTSDIAPLLQQTFKYLARGRQSYAFESEDGTLVLKIPRFDRYRIPFIWKAMPSFFRARKKQSKIKDKQTRLAFTLGSFEIAASELMDQTGLIYSHFRSTQTLPRQCFLQDSLGRSYCIDPNRTVFVLQKKLPLLFPKLFQAVEQKESAASQALALCFLELLDTRAKLGIFNKDPSFRKNFALEQGKAVQIDIGSFHRKQHLAGRQAHQRSLIEGTEPFREWLGQRDSELLVWFNERLSEKIAEQM